MDGSPQYPQSLVFGIRCLSPSPPSFFQKRGEDVNWGSSALRFLCVPKGETFVTKAKSESIKEDTPRGFSLHSLNRQAERFRSPCLLRSGLMSTGLKSCCFPLSALCKGAVA
ncbi:uncharacterized protein LOC143666298 [Tamandua tetradactyla]|uniref:uncharacterized protein LOC143666298 n=1 Tax=Tamandua tetradactyla TaxID=48850 RepID=UPI0040538BFC